MAASATIHRAGPDAIAGVVAAFIFGYTNLREQQAALSQGYENLKQQQQAVGKQDQESRYSSISQVELDVDVAIADHPRLISCFEDVTCNAKPALTSEEMQQASALAVYIVDFYQYLYDQLENLGDVPDNGRFTVSRRTSLVSIRSFPRLVTKTGLPGARP